MSGDSFDRKYEKIRNIAKGSFGEVNKHRDIQSNSIVAEKWIPFEDTRNGLPSLVLREISLLKELNHENVVRLLDVVDTSTGCHLVFEYLQYGLGTFIKDGFNPIDPSLIKAFLYQILKGVSYCHSQKVLHRDLKPDNLLLDLETKTVKLADFGYARTFEVTTLAYEVPELMLGTQYNSTVDIWSVGCIFAELVKREPLFGGCLEEECMTKGIGVPSERDWPGITSACLRFCKMKTLPSERIPDLASIVRGLEPD